jgi:ribosomal protein S6
MGRLLVATNKTVNQIVEISNTRNLNKGLIRYAVVSYKDHCDEDLIV